MLSLLQVKKKVVATLILAVRNLITLFVKNGLVDLPLEGKKFTWFGYGEKLSRFDIFLVSIDLVTVFSSLCQKGLRYTISNHYPILLVEDSINWGPKPFKFFDFWLFKEDCLKMIKSEWSSFCVLGSTSFSLKIKLSKLKTYLKRWNQEVYGFIDDRI
ncbi:hypothetical protein REPUB_Repub09cG0162300 [Reevesia pubescens]